MVIVSNIIGWCVMAYFLAIPGIWIWVFFHKIKCRRKESCSRKKCLYWEWCSHNIEEKRRADIAAAKRLLKEWSESGEI